MNKGNNNQHKDWVTNAPINWIATNNRQNYISYGTSYMCYKQLLSLPTQHQSHLICTPPLASSDSDDDVIVTSLFLLTSIVHEKHKLNERGQKRKTWKRDWIAKRRQYGAYHRLVREIRDSDPATYRNFLRMDDEISLHHSVQNILVTDQLKCVNLCPNLLNFIMYIIISNNLWTKFWVPPITSLYYMFTLCGCVDTATWRNHVYELSACG